MLPPRSISARCAVVPLFVFILGSCWQPNEQLTITAQALKERCPNEAFQDATGAWRHEDSVFVPLAGKITRIPEYHDCQRLLTREMRYGPLVGVWARDELQSVDTLLYLRPEGVAVAELLNFSKTAYPLLGIGEGYNCLYLRRRTGQWEGLMVHLGPEPHCPNQPSAATHRITYLEVKVQPRTRNLAPPAARWDMDPETRTQYIGVWCPDGWCEVGLRGFTPSREYAGPQEVRVKGWYDEQYLSVYDKKTRMLRPSTIRGRTIPDSALPHLTVNHFTCDPCTDHWVRVATVIIEKDSAGYYQNKLNLRSGVPTEVFVRYNRPQDIWEAKLSNAAGVAYRRTIRIDHRNIRVPGTSRWHFVEHDETVWVRCDDGCCDVRGL